MRKNIVLLFMLVFLLSAKTYAADVKLSEAYIEDTGEYRYYLNENDYVTSSQQLGRIVENVIKFSFGDRTHISLTKDGEAVEIVSGGYIYDNGSYVLTISNGKDSGSIGFIIREPSSEDIADEESLYSKSPLIQSYSIDKNMYSISMGDMYSFYSNIPNYAVTDKSVKIYAPADKRMNITIYKDGAEASFSSGKTFSDPGYYVMSLVYDSADIDDERYTEGELQGFSDEAMDSADINVDRSYFNVANVAVYSFYIINGPQNRLNYIDPPQDYTISSVMLEGQKQPLENAFYKAEQDGNYRVLFKSNVGKLPDYTLNFTRDTDIPMLAFEGVGEGGIALDRFGIIKDKEDTSVEIYKGGVLQTNASDEIDEPGLYRIVASDKAGNANAYIINLKRKSFINILWIIPAAIIIAAAIKIYSSYVRRNIHIR